MQTCDMLENHDFSRKLIKHLVAIVISVRVAIGWCRVALVRVGSGRLYLRPEGGNNRSIGAFALSWVESRDSPLRIFADGKWRCGFVGICTG